MTSRLMLPIKWTEKYLTSRKQSAYHKQTMQEWACVKMTATFHDDNEPSHRVLRRKRRYYLKIL